METDMPYYNTFFNRMTNRGQEKIPQQRQEQQTSAFTGTSPMDLNQRLNAIRGRLLGQNNGPSRPAPVRTRQGMGGPTPVLSQESGPTVDRAANTQRRLSGTFAEPIQRQQRPNPNMNPYNTNTHTRAGVAQPTLFGDYYGQ